ncbi:DNA-binding protein [Thermococcus sp.]|uniref:DNA-binding protein n=1 Tax=Thermococcus sp. TaxID=35749 RepID=UPI00262D23E5|nr:DNA-binding protein [Thermococcus sp.]
MGKLELVLEQIKREKRTPLEIAEKLGTTVEEVEGIIEILKSLGYVEEIRRGSSTCETCPLKKICGGKCFVSRNSGGVRILKFRVKD